MCEQGQKITCEDERGEVHTNRSAIVMALRSGAVDGQDVYYATNGPYKSNFKRAGEFLVFII